MKRLAATMVLMTIALLVGAARPACALESAPVSSKRAVATFVSETDAVQPGGTLRVGLRLRMAPGWHTYWKNPGDAGVPPELTIAGGQSPIDWPAPRRIAEGSVMTYGYTGEVLLPVTVTAAAGTLKAHAEWLVCKDICVPEDGDFSLTLAAGTAGPSPQAGLFAEHDRAVPRASPWTARIAPDGVLFVQAPELSTATVADAWFIPDQ
ncbi:MAG TPA: protein-disulfide reductase DsbD domain-containing protein, partial [Acetobacteraceae bacterium]